MHSHLRPRTNFFHLMQTVCKIRYQKVRIMSYFLLSDTVTLLQLQWLLWHQCSTNQDLSNPNSFLIVLTFFFTLNTLIKEDIFIVAIKNVQWYQREFFISLNWVSKVNISQTMTKVHNVVLVNAFFMLSHFCFIGYASFCDISLFSFNSTFMFN